MVEVIVYVEGVSDKLAMEALLRPLLEHKRQQGISITFAEAPPGDKKESVLMRVPRQAINILRNKPNAIVIAMPDLYPKNKLFPHETFDQLKAGIEHRFQAALAAKQLQDDRLIERFKVFCFKYEMEALILAAPQALALRLNTDKLDITWKIPVENQNHDTPPKIILEALFQHHHAKYKETVDSPLILGMADYQQIAEACSQCFKPFVDFIKNL
jgi:hypothetical protein